MGNLDFSANADQLKELAAYMASQINVPTIGIGGGYAPIGTIISVMGTTAPQDYLACDGTVYNIADYPQLADYFESQFGESNHFGGNGTTTFAVPDLRGEFLRGTGTNGHANQGSGANVGEHQDGTLITPIFETTAVWSPTELESVPINNDHVLSSRTRNWTKTGLSTTSDGVIATSRPTNTSVLYCIKAVVAGEVYSTEERVVGTWIDGKKLYQKTVSFTMPNSLDDTLVVPVSDISNAVDVLWVEKGFIYFVRPDNSKVFMIIPNFYNSSDRANLYFETAVGLRAGAIGGLFTGRSAYATLQYTKTTD